MVRSRRIFGNQVFRVMNGELKPYIKGAPMRYSNIFAAAIFAAFPLTARADGGFLSIPASEFSGNGVAYSNSGTATFIRTTAFAPILMPDDATVTFFSCGGRATFAKEVIFTLRRNDPPTGHTHRHGNSANRA